MTDTPTTDTPRIFIIGTTREAGIAWCRRTGIPPAGGRTRLLVHPHAARGLQITDADTIFNLGGPIAPSLARDIAIARGALTGEWFGLELWPKSTWSENDTHRGLDERLVEADLVPARRRPDATPA